MYLFFIVINTRMKSCVWYSVVLLLLLVCLPYPNTLNITEWINAWGHGPTPGLNPGRVQKASVVCCEVDIYCFCKTFKGVTCLFLYRTINTRFACYQYLNNVTIFNVFRRQIYCYPGISVQVCEVNVKLYRWQLKSEKTNHMCSL